MSTALIGIIGVAAGALATGGVQAYLGWRERRVDAIASVRLMWYELRHSVLRLQEMLGQDEWVEPLNLERPLAVWDEEKRAISRASSNREFESFAAAAAHLLSVQAWHDSGASFESMRSEVAVATRICIQARVTAFIAGEPSWSRLKHNRKLRAGEKSKALYEPEVPASQAGIPEIDPAK